MGFHYILNPPRVLLESLVKLIDAHTVLPAKSDFMFCLQNYQGLIIDISLVY